MMEFNLLPHRAQQRQRRRHRFYSMLLLAALLGAAFAGVGLYAIDRQQQRQQARNRWLQHAHDRLDTEIKRAVTLQQEIDGLVARTKHIEMLQRQRGRTARLLSTLAAQVPQDTYLQKMTQHDRKITLDGYATSNKAVTEFLQNLNAQADSIESAQLLETRAASSNDAEQLAFSVALTLRKPR